jgi:broad specificity phosphatase PhoE
MPQGRGLIGACAPGPRQAAPTLEDYRPTMTMPLDLVLVRHGESEGNEAVRRARGGDDALLLRVREHHSSFWRLTEEGIAQAQRCGEWLRGSFPQGFDRYYTSEYARAMETAAWLGLSGAEWYVHPDLRERSWGDLDRLTSEERQEHFAESLAEKAASPFYWRPPNGESIAEVGARLRGIVRGLQSDCPAGMAILVCHGELIGAFRAKLEYMSQDDYRRWATDPAERLLNGEVVQYSRRDPDSGEIADDLEWRRSVVPGDATHSKAWRRLSRPRYDAEGLLAAVDEVPRVTEGEK